MPQGSTASGSRYHDSGQPSSFATLLHQAKDDASADTDSSDKDTQEQDKSAKQPALAVLTSASVPVVQQTIAPIVGFLMWGATTGNSEKSTGQAESDASAAPADEKKADAAAGATGATLLLQAIAGLGTPQLTQPLPGQRSANNQQGKPRVDADAGVVAATGLSASTNAPAGNPTGPAASTNVPDGNPGGHVDIRASAVTAATGLSTSTNAQAIVAANDASVSLSSVSLGTDGSRKGGSAEDGGAGDGSAGTLVPTTSPEGDGKTALSSGQLAFAARLSADTVSVQASSQLQPSLSQPLQSAQQQASHLQTADASIQSSSASEIDAIQPVVAATQTVQTGSEQAGEHAQKSEAQASPALSAASDQVAATRADTALTLDQPADVRSADVDQTPAAGANATAVHDVRLQVAGSGDQRVDVRVMDRGGELRVSVRADDPSLVRSLQDNVADLSTRLDQAHFQSEVWTPRTQAISQTDSASTDGRTFSNGGETSGRDGQGQQQNGRQQQQPFWVDDFEENPAGQNSGGTPQWQP